MVGDTTAIAEVKSGDELMAMKRKLKAACIGLLCGGVPLVTTASCDPLTGRFDFFRDDDNEFYDDEFYYEEEFFFDGGFYNDCFFGCF